MAYNPSRDTCATCVHFTLDEDQETGTCRRYPPSYIARQHEWSSAAVTVDNTCGEFDSIISDDHVDNKNCH